MPRPTWRHDAHRPVVRPEPPAIMRYRFGIFIFVVLFFILLLCLLKALQWCRPEETYDPDLGDLDAEFPNDLESGQTRTDHDIADHTLYLDAGNTPSITTGPGGDRLFNGIRGRSRDDPYEAAVSSLISLEAQTPGTETPQYLQYIIRDVRKFQRLVTKLRTASYSSSSENDPEGSERRREIEQIHMQIAELVVNTPAHLRGPRLQVYTEPPPAYYDIESSSSNAAFDPLPPPFSPSHQAPPHLL